MNHAMTQEPATITPVHSTPSSGNTGPLPNAEQAEYDPYEQVVPVPTIVQVMNMPNGASTASAMSRENTSNMVNGEVTGNAVNGGIAGHAMNGDNTGPPPNEDEIEYNPYLPAVLPTVPAALVMEKRRGENSGPLPNQNQMGNHSYPVPTAHVANNLGENGIVPPMSPGPPPYMEVKR